MSGGSMDATPSVEPAGAVPERAAVTRRTVRRRPWLPDQHGAWAMLAVPLLLGIAASRPVPAQLLLAVAAVSGYLALATAQVVARDRARRRGSRGPRASRPDTPPALGASLVLYGTVAAVAGMPLVLLAPPLLAAVPALAAVGVASMLLARHVRGRPLAARLLDAAPAALLTPAAAVIAGPVAWTTVAAATGIAIAYLIGTLLVVRAAIRERGNARFAAVSVAWHIGAALTAAALLPLPYAAAGSLLALRAVGVPVLQRRLARDGRQLRPVRLGMVELAAAALLVASAFAVRP